MSLIHPIGGRVSRRAVPAKTPPIRTKQGIGARRVVKANGTVLGRIPGGLGATDRDVVGGRFPSEIVMGACVAGGDLRGHVLRLLSRKLTQLATRPCVSIESWFVLEYTERSIYAVY